MASRRAVVIEVMSMLTLLGLISGARAAKMCCGVCGM
jgi:hypothetical protein